MNPTDQPHDDQLRDLLRKSGQVDRHRAPSFQRVWQAALAARAAHAAAPPRVRWLAWAAGAAAAACVIFMVSRPPAPAPETDNVAAITNEPLPAKALPTDFLLTASTDAKADHLADEITALLKP